METVWLGLGANQGDREAHCRQALAALASHPHIQVGRQSRWYQTEPVDYRDQAWFLNLVVEIQTDLAPVALLKELKALEAAAGRTAEGPRFGPRPLDMDILLYGSQVLTMDALIIPHPRLHLRHFVLRPLCDLVPEASHPVLGRTLRQLLEALDISDQKVSPYL